MLLAQKNGLARNAKEAIVSIIQNSKYSREFVRYCPDIDFSAYPAFIASIEECLDVSVAPNPYGDLFTLRICLRSRRLRQALADRFSRNVKSIIQKTEELRWLRDVLDCDSDLTMELNIDWSTKTHRQMIHQIDVLEFLDEAPGNQMKHFYSGTERATQKNWFRSLMDDHSSDLSRIIIGGSANDE